MSKQSNRSQSQKIQGEGDKEAARHYAEKTRDFVETGKVAEAAERAKGQEPKEAEQAEQAAKERTKERDPAVHRDYHKPNND